MSPIDPTAHADTQKMLDALATLDLPSLLAQAQYEGFALPDDDSERLARLRDVCMACAHEGIQPADVLLAVLFLADVLSLPFASLEAA